MTSTPSERRLNAQAAAHTRWSRTPDRAQALAPARAGFLKKLEDQVDPNHELAPDVRATLVESAIKARYRRMAAKSATARRKRKGAV